MTEQEIKFWIIQQAEHFINIWNDSSDIKAISIESYFNLKGHCAGQYCRRQDGNYFRWNITIATNYQTEYLKTIAHEVAHHIVNTVDKATNCKSRSHGARWHHIMIVLGFEPKRCHNYKTEPARKIPHVTTFKCPKCGISAKLTLVKYKKMLKTIKADGTVNYFCKCRHQVNLVNDCHS